MTLLSENRYGPHVTNVRDEEPDPLLVPLSPDGLELLSFDRTTDKGLGWAAYFSPEVEKVRAIVLLRIGPEHGPEGKPMLLDEEPRIYFPVNHAKNAALEVRELRVSVAPQTAGFASALLREIPITRIEAAINYPAIRAQLIDNVMPVNTISQGEIPGGNRYLLRPEKPFVLEKIDMRVDDPGGYRKPDEFYALVADRYLRLAATSTRPAQELAAYNGVPAATVHRWIREAKIRGLIKLPTHRPGEPGRNVTRQNLQDLRGEGDEE